MSGPVTPAVVLISDERMLGDLIVAYLESVAPDLTVLHARALGELDPSEARHASVILFLRRTLQHETLLVELRHAQKTLPKASLGIISDFRNCDLVQEAFELGVNGFISSHMSAKSLIHYIRLLMLDGEVMSPRLLSVLAADGATPANRDEETAVGKIRGLPAQERDVLNLLRQGKPNKAIGAALGMLESEVKVRVRSLMRKFGVRNRVQLVLATDAASNGDASSPLTAPPHEAADFTAGARVPPLPAGTGK